jgi:hypothetical protein
MSLANIYCCRRKSVVSASTTHYDSDTVIVEINVTLFRREYSFVVEEIQALSKLSSTCVIAVEHQDFAVGCRAARHAVPQFTLHKRWGEHNRLIWLHL